MPYLCNAEQQVRVKAHASTPDKRQSAPSRGTLSCRTSKPGLDKSSIGSCQQNQHNVSACVYRFSTTSKQVSTDLVYEQRKCLVKSGKVNTVRAGSLYPVRPVAMSCTSGRYILYVRSLYLVRPVAMSCTSGRYILRAGNG